MEDSKNKTERPVSLQKLFPDIYASSPEYLTQQQAAEICQVSSKTIRGWQEQKKLPSPKNGKMPGNRHQIKLDDAVICLLERKWSQETYNLFPAALKAFYTKNYRAFPDGLLTRDVIAMTGYNHNLVYKWIQNGYLKCYSGGNKHRIPKKYLIDFVCGPHFQGIERKSCVHKADIRSFMNNIARQLLPSTIGKDADEEGLK